MELVADAGRWLRHFHDARMLNHGFLDTGLQLADYDQLLASSGSIDPQSAAAVQLLRETAESIDAVPLARSWAHGDFKSANILTSDEGMFGIDVSGRHNGVVAFDLAMFLNDLAMFAYGWRARHLEANLPGLEAAFLTGYGIEPSGQAASAITWLRTILLVSTWSNLSRSIGGRLRQHLRETAHRTTLDRLSNALTLYG